jgi:predicted PurR-regulated permease PerM
MKKVTDDLTFYIKASQIIVGVVALFFIIYIGQDIIIPLVFSIILAILLNPLVNYLTNKKCNRVIAILLVEIVALILAAALIIFIFSQLSVLGDNLPQLRQKFDGAFRDLVNWVADKFNMSPGSVKRFVDKTTHDGMENSTSVISSTLSTISHFFVNALLVPVYVFMILFYKVLLLKFISKVFANEKHGTVVDVLTQVKSMIQSYLVGLLFEIGIVAFLNTVSLLIIGVPYAILLGLSCALLNLIPYIGGLVAVGITMTFAFLTKSTLAALLVFIAHITIQFIDNNLLVPKIVGSKVKINALASIVVVLIGGAMCGIPGMFLAIPVTAVIKVICDRIAPLEPLGYLLGDTMPAIGKNIFSYIKPK